MNSVKKKNAVGIAIIVLLTAVLITVVVLTAVNANKKEIEREFFIDTAPIDYSKPENAVYAKRFRLSITGYFSDLSEYIDLTVFADRLLNALSVSRIPAKKLGGLAVAVDKFNADSLLSSIQNGGLTEEQLKEILEKSTFQYVGGFIDALFEESGLTDTEFALFLYNYLNLYGETAYKKALQTMGQSNFVAFFSSTAYFITSVSDVKGGGGTFISPNALQSAFYQLGSVYKKTVDESGVDVLEKVLSIQWTFSKNKLNYEKINEYTAKMQGKLGLIFPLLGCVLQQVTSEDIGFAWEYNTTQNKDILIVSQTGIAKAVKAGLNEFILRYGEGFGASNFVTLKTALKELFYNMYNAQWLATGGKETDEKILKRIADAEKNIDGFFTAMDVLTEKEYTLDDVVAIKGTPEYDTLLKSVDGFWSMAQDADYFTCMALYLWVGAQMDGLQTEDAK